MYILYIFLDLYVSPPPLVLFLLFLLPHPDSPTSPSFSLCLALSETPQFYRYNWGLDWQWALWQAEVGAYPGQRHESEATRTRAKCLQVQGVCVLLCISGWLTIHWVIHTGLEPSCPCLPGPAMTGFLWIHLCSALIDCGVISVFTGDAALSFSVFVMSSLGIWVILASWNGLG